MVRSCSGLDARRRPSSATRWLIAARALLTWPTLANFTFEYAAAAGSAAMSAFGTTLRATMSVKSAGCEYPFSQSSWPWSE